MTTEKARQLRQNQTLAEQQLWQRLRNRQLQGYKFRRQYPIAGYIVDFVCLAEKLVIELDGSHHADFEQQAYDVERTKVLQAGGFRVLRFWNHQVDNAMDTVLTHITQALTTSTNSLSHGIRVRGKS